MNLSDTPVLVDLETRSACDLRLAGGWNYAADPSTHIFMAAWSPEPEEYHIWYPWHAEGTIREDYTAAQGTKATAHFGPHAPAALLAVTNRRWAAHNAWNFDSLVWRAKMPDHAQPVDWIDTEPLARAISLPGGLDAIGQRLWGEGKYKAAKHALKKHMAGQVFGDAADIPAGIMPLLAEYNIQDVFLLRGVWEEIVRWAKLPQEEWDVLAAHRAINHRGAPVDEDLIESLVYLTEEGRVHAVKAIADLTRGGKIELKTINDLQSIRTMFAWLDSIGITEFTNNVTDAKTGRVKSSLRRELVTQFLDAKSAEAAQGDDDDSDAERDDAEDDSSSAGMDAGTRREDAARTALAVRVLQLRSAAMRVTGGKLSAAASAVCMDGRIRGLFVYSGAHTGRWAGRRVQVQNLPRPKDGIGDIIWELINVHERRDKDEDGRMLRPTLTYGEVDDRLPDRNTKRFRYLTADDAASALIRSIFTAGDNDGWESALNPWGILAADLSNIEARVTARLAGEKWLMDAFWAGHDPYIPMAENIFGPRESWPGYDPKTVKKHPRRQIGKVVELGANFGLGGRQMNIYAAASGINLAENDTDGPTCVLAYRKSHPAIAGREAGEYEGIPYFRDGFWHKLNDAALSAVYARGSEHKVGSDGMYLTFAMDGPHLAMYLPSGRRLLYRNAKVEPHQPKFLKGSDKTIDAVVYTSPRFGRVPLYGAKIAENAVQGTARDYVAAALVRLENLRPALPAVMHVHDEGASIGRLSDKSRFMNAFTTLPSWSPNFPLDAEGGWLPRYAKSPPKGEKYREEVWRNGEYLKYA